MKKTIQFAMITMLAASAYTSLYAQQPTAIKPKRNKTMVMNYLKSVIVNHQIIAGQQCSEVADVAQNYRVSFQAVYDSTGKYPGVLGLEYGYFPNVDLKLTNQYAINHWNKGGLVTISWHADNPWKDGYDIRWNAIKHRDSIKVMDLLKNAPESKAKLSYRTELARIASALQQLKKSGVVVLWRPLHEVSGAWFWWGINDEKNPTNQKDYQALWKDMYETLTTDYGLDNLIWVYTPFTTKGYSSKVLTEMYPGSGYVDVVGVDAYGKAPEFENYSTLEKLNKIIANGELGPNKGSYGNYDELKILEVFKGKAAYFLQWSSWKNAKVSITDNLNYKEMMSHPDVITLDKIKM